MAEYEALTRAFSGLGGLGVEEKSLVSAFGTWHGQPEKRSLFRRSTSRIFAPHGENFEKWQEDFVHHLKAEFSRFHELVLEWAMHPWERDARWAHHVLHKAQPVSILVEVACTRSSEELLGARKAYHALYHHSLEEDVAFCVKESNAKLLVRLVSVYRYEGSHVHEERAKSEAKKLNTAVKNGGSLVENYDIIRILSTRSKPYLKATFKFYNELYGKSFSEDIENDVCLQETVECLESPPTYFSKLINKALQEGANANEKEALSRVVVSRAEVDIAEIGEAYHKQFGTKLEDAIAKSTHGNYRDSLLSLVSGKGQ